MEVAALLAVAQDHTFGQPPGAQLRATVLGQRLAAAAGASAAELAATWWTSALRFLGCTGHSFELAALFGDEIETRARSMLTGARSMKSLTGPDNANPPTMINPRRLSTTTVAPRTDGTPRRSRFRTTGRSNA